MMKYIVALTTALCLTSGCATMRDSVILGAGSGMASGIAVGAIASSGHRGSGALIGGAIGAAVGGITAYFVHKGLDDHDSKVRKETLFGLENFGVSEVPRQGSAVPAISFPVREEQVVETHREGNKVIEHHHIWYLGDDSNLQYTGPDSSEKKKR